MQTRGITRAELIQQHLSWLTIYVQEMRPENWIDMQLRCARQLDALRKIVPSGGKADCAKLADRIDLALTIKSGGVSFDADELRIIVDALRGAVA